MTSLSVRLYTWHVLVEADEARKAAWRSATKSATLHLGVWLEYCADMARQAASPEAFDRMMQGHGTNQLTADEVSLCCQLFEEGRSELLERVRGMLKPADFPFAVQVYQSKENTGNFILTIPNQGGLAED